jgi:hypothetical protein
MVAFDDDFIPHVDGITVSERKVLEYSEDLYIEGIEIANKYAGIHCGKFNIPEGSEDFRKVHRSCLELVMRRISSQITEKNIREFGIYSLSGADLDKILSEYK